MDKKAPQIIRDWLKLEGRKSNWLAAQIPAAVSTVSVWLSGGRTPNAIFRKRLEEITGLPVSGKETWE